MMIFAYRDRASGRYPITLDEVRSRADVLFGEEPPQALLEQMQLDPVISVGPPEHDVATQALTELQPILLAGQFHQVWQIADRPREVPQSVTSAQAVIALKRAGLLATLTEALAGHEHEEAAIWFNRAQTWERTNSNLLVLAQQLGLSEAQVDDLFVAADKIA